MPSVNMQIICSQRVFLTAMSESELKKTCSFKRIVNKIVSVEIVVNSLNVLL